jgi:protein involved in polysaccharide export with SLBB domain
MPAKRALSSIAFLLATAALTLGSGCRAVHSLRNRDIAPVGDMPRELCKTVLPTYRIEPPDILIIDAVHIVPRPPYHLKTLDVLRVDMQRAAEDRLQPLDVLAIRVAGALPEAPIEGLYPVQRSGVVNLPPYAAVQVAGLSLEQARQAIEKELGRQLADPTAEVTLAEAGAPIQGGYSIQLGGVIDFGLPYGQVRVVGLTVEEAGMEIRRHLSRFFDDPQVNVSLLQTGASQQLAGEHLVNPDGTVTLGAYGSVNITGLTLAEAKMVIEQHLSQFLEDPEVAVTVFAYNSKVYYIITEGAGLGDGVFRFPVTGNETVLDAMSQINGLDMFSSKRIWIARPTPDPECLQILPVDWDQITACGVTNTNYQLLPGDRLYVAEDKLVALDTRISKLVAPVERVMGFSILGVGTVTRFTGRVLRGGGNVRSNF